MFLPSLSACNSVELYILVICNGFGGMKQPKKDFIDIQFII